MILELSGLYFHEFFAVCGIIITSITIEYDGLVCSFTKKLLLYSNITSNVNGSRTQKFHSSFIFLFYFGFLCRYWQLLEQQRKGGVHLYSSLPFAFVLKYLSFVCSFVSDVTTFYFSIATHVIAKVLIDETYQLLPMIKCQFHIYLLIFCQIRSIAISHRQTSIILEFVSTITI